MVVQILSKLKPQVQTSCICERFSRILWIYKITLQENIVFKTLMQIEKQNLTRNVQLGYNQAYELKFHF